MATAGFEKLLVNIPQLKSEKDWLVWKFQVTHAMKAAGLWDYVAGTERDEEDRVRKEQKAFYLILQCLGQKYVPMVMNCTTTKDMWDTLCGTFERKTISNKVYTLMKLYGLRMKKGTRIQDHLRQLDELADHLAAIGEEVSEIHKVAILLQSVQESYSTLVTALLARGEDELTLVCVKQALLDEEQRRGKANYDSIPEMDSQNSDSALRAGRSFRKGQKGAICHYCKEPGHFIRNCPKLRNKHCAKKVKEAKEDSDSGGDESLFVATLGLKADTQQEDWIIDSGASRHMTFQKDVLSYYRKFETPEPVGLGDGRTVNALGTGKVKIMSYLYHGKKTVGWMTDVLYVPKLTSNLFSVHAAALKGNVVSIGQKYCQIRNKKKRLIGTGSPLGRLYRLNCDTLKTPTEKTIIAEETKSLNKIDLWHQRLAHVNEKQLHQLVANSTGIDLSSSEKQRFCEPCVKGKMHRLPHPLLKKIKSKEKLQLVYTDICGPMQTQSFGGSRYFITFTDDFSRYCKTYFLKQKNEALEKFKEFKQSIENESGLKIKALRSDRGGEYMSEEFQHYLKECGIKSEATAAYSPQQNGVAERLNRTLVEAARTMLTHASLSNAFWAEAVATTTYLRNRMVSTVLKNGKTPFQLWYGKKPDLKHLRVFGCVAYIHVPDIERRKLDKKAKKLRFIGYTETAGNYRVWDETKHKCYIRHDVIFNELDFDFNKMGDTSQQEQELEVTEVSSKEVNIDLEEREPDDTEQETPLRRSERERRPCIRYGIDEYANKAFHIAYQAAEIEEPATIKEALTSDYSAEWKAAADSEYCSLMENDTWDLVDLPVGRKAVGCKWIFHVKYDSQGETKRFKGRLVAQGFLQKYGIDYDEIFSPVARLSSIRSLLAYATERGMLIHQMDVVTAFLNGDLKEEIYMCQPPGYVQTGKEDKVCKLKKSLYGLKQSPRCWNEKFCNHLKQLGFKESGADPCIFSCESKEKALEIIAVYVDDLILITETSDEMWSIKKMSVGHIQNERYGESAVLSRYNLYSDKR